MSAPIQRKVVGSEAYPVKAIPAPGTTFDKPPHKNVAFMFPPDVEEVRSICQSPSWEAYDRRKKEKAEVKREKKDEKKNKEQAFFDAKPRGRRLSKAPPIIPACLPAMGLGDRSMSDLEIPTRQIQPKPRPTSVVGTPIHKTGEEHKNEKVEKAAKAEKPEKKRRRSSSLTSLIRSSFEIRRPSFDRDIGFIGGVKLEQNKQDFHQQVLDDQAKGTSKVHPALRKSFIGHGSFTPIKTPQEKESKRRGCPPISINATAARNPGLLTPTSPSPRKPDFTNIYLWSARANRGAQSDDEYAIADDSEMEDSKGQRPSSAEQSDHNGKGGLARSGGIYLKSSPPPEHGPTLNPDIQRGERPSSVDSKESLSKSQPAKEALTPSTQSSTKSKASKPPIASAPKSRSRRGSLTSLFSSAPEPPRKSSKRNSLIYLSRLQSSSQDESDNSEDLLNNLKNPYTPPNLELTRPVEEKAAPKNTSSRQKSDNMIHSSPPSIPYEKTSAGASPKMYTAEVYSPTHPRWTLKDAVNAAFRRGSSSQSSLASPLTGCSPRNGEGSFSGLPKQADTESSPTTDDRQKGHSRSTSSTSRIPGEKMEPPVPRSLGSWRPETSSSEDESNSDAVPSVSPMSTPHTTPPQSEMDYPHSGATIRKVDNYNTHKRNSKSWSSNDSPHLLTNARYEPSLTSTEASDRRYDPIQAAAQKVMEAFPPSSQHQGADNNYHGRAPYPPLQLKDKALHSQSSTPLTPSSPLSPQSPRVVLSKGHRVSRSTSEIPSKSYRQELIPTSTATPGETVAKMFVECCTCKYYHDMPSKLYEAMADPNAVLNSTDNLGFLGTISMTVKCPWCKHEMSTRCCAGFAAMVYIKERLH